MMNIPARTTKFILYVAVITWLLVLTKFILFKKTPGYYKQYFKTELIRSNYKTGLKQANFIPFKTLHLILNSNLNAEYKLENIAGNIAGFIPLSILLLALFPYLRKAWKITAVIFIISLAYETIQLFTRLGSFDVDDLILNVCGGLIGYIIFRCIIYITHMQNKPTVNISA